MPPRGATSYTRRMSSFSVIPTFSQSRVNNARRTRVCLSRRPSNSPTTNWSLATMSSRSCIRHLLPVPGPTPGQPGSGQQRLDGPAVADGHGAVVARRDGGVRVEAHRSEQGGRQVLQRDRVAVGEGRPRVGDAVDDAGPGAAAGEDAAEAV